MESIEEKLKRVEESYKFELAEEQRKIEEAKKL